MLARISASLKSLLSHSGELSMVRFLSLMCVVTACALGFIGMFVTAHTLESVAVLCGTFLGAGLGAKVVQKRTEVKASTVFKVSGSGASRTSAPISNVAESGQNEDEK